MLKKYNAGIVLVWGIVATILVVLASQIYFLLKVMFPELSIVKVASVIGSLSTGGAFSFAAWQYRKNLIGEENKHHFNEAKEEIKIAQDYRTEDLDNDCCWGRKVDYIVTINNIAESVAYHVGHITDDRLKQTLAQKWLSFILNTFSPNMNLLADEAINTLGISEVEYERIRKENVAETSHKNIPFAHVQYNLNLKLMGFAIGKGLLKFDDDFVKGNDRELKSLVPILQLILIHSEYQSQAQRISLEKINDTLYKTVAPLNIAFKVLEKAR